MKKVMLVSVAPSLRLRCTFVVTCKFFQKELSKTISNEKAKGHPTDTNNPYNSLLDAI